MLKHLYFLSTYIWFVCWGCILHIVLMYIILSPKPTQQFLFFPSSYAPSIREKLHPLSSKNLLSFLPHTYLQKDNDTVHITYSPFIPTTKFIYQNEEYFFNRKGEGVPASWIVQTYKVCTVETSKPFFSLTPHTRLRLIELAEIFNKFSPETFIKSFPYYYDIKMREYPLIRANNTLLSAREMLQPYLNLLFTNPSFIKFSSLKKLYLLDMRWAFSHNKIICTPVSSREKESQYLKKIPTKNILLK